MSHFNFWNQLLWMRLKLPKPSWLWCCNWAGWAGEPELGLQFQGTLRALKLCPKTRSWEMAGEEISVYLEKCLLCFSINSVLLFLRTFPATGSGYDQLCPLWLYNLRSLPTRLQPCHLHLPKTRNELKMHLLNSQQLCLLFSQLLF